MIIEKPKENVKYPTCGCCGSHKETMIYFASIQKYVCNKCLIEIGTDTIDSNPDKYKKVKLYG